MVCDRVANRHAGHYGLPSSSRHGLGTSSLSMPVESPYTEQPVQTASTGREASRPHRRGQRANTDDGSLMPIDRALQVSVDVRSSLAPFARAFEYLDLRPAITDRSGAEQLRELQRSEARSSSSGCRSPTDRWWGRRAERKSWCSTTRPRRSTPRASGSSNAPSSRSCTSIASMWPRAAASTSSSDGTASTRDCTRSSSAPEQFRRFAPTA